MIFFARTVPCPYAKIEVGETFFDPIMRIPMQKYTQATPGCPGMYIPLCPEERGNQYWAGMGKIVSKIVEIEIFADTTDT